MKVILWIESIVESTPTTPSLSTYSVNMTGFIDLHKVVIQSNAFLAFASAQNESV